jgi:hypothetical protein
MSGGGDRQRAVLGHLDVGVELSVSVAATVFATVSSRVSAGVKTV